MLKEFHHFVHSKVEAAIMLKRILIFILLLSPIPVFAEEFVAGKDYQIISPKMEENAGNRQVTVTEFFSYGCPWCYRIEPALANWVKKQGKTVTFMRVPVVFHKEWLFYAKAYYAVHLLSLEEKLNSLLFKTIQEEKYRLHDNQAMIDFFTAQGIDKTTATSAFEHSTIIDMQVNQGVALMTRFQVNAVPAIVINDHYKIDLQMAGGEDRFFEILNFIIKKVT